MKRSANYGNASGVGDVAFHFTTELSFLKCQGVELKTSRNGPRNFLSADQSVIANTLSEKQFAKSSLITMRKSSAVCFTSFPNAPRPKPRVLDTHSLLGVALMIGMILHAISPL